MIELKPTEPYIVSLRIKIGEGAEEVTEHIFDPVPFSSSAWIEYSRMISDYKIVADPSEPTGYSISKKGDVILAAIKLYDSSIKAVKGYAMGGAALNCQPKEEWIELVPVEHKMKVINTLLAQEKIGEAKIFFGPSRLKP